jgi:lipoprotein NlpI
MCFYRKLSSLAFVVVTSLTCAALTAEENAPGELKSAAELRAQAVAALHEGDGTAAVRAADALVEQHADQASARLLAADVYLRCGKFKDAVKWFDRYLEVSPQSLPSLWQRGIALYFVHDYKRGADQFEEHRKVNPNDVENAAWHFLCVAKLDSIDKARRMVLPAPNDPRLPMEEVLAMLSSGDSESVRKRMESLPTGSAARRQADFYGSFYLGLHADANGDQREALHWLRQAAAEAPHHYMGDVARVYVAFLEKVQPKL